MLKKILLLTVFVSYFLFPIIVFAANVGFVPSTGLWFSRTSFLPGETISVYTVIFNNDYYGLDGTVVFYDNNNVIGAVSVKNLSEESAKQLKVLWQPVAGEHALSARFTSATVVDSEGNRTNLDLASINGVTGAPLEVGSSTAVSADNTVVPQETGSVASGNAASSTAIGATDVMVANVNGKLIITPPGALESGSSVGGSVADAIHSAVSSIGDIFAKNHLVLGQVNSSTAIVTSTVGSLADAYGSTKDTVEAGKNFYQKADEAWKTMSVYLVKAGPVFNKIKAGWLWFTDGNDPTRVMVIVGIFVVVFIIAVVRRRHRRRKKIFG